MNKKLVIEAQKPYSEVDGAMTKKAEELLGTPRSGLFAFECACREAGINVVYFAREAALDGVSYEVAYFMQGTQKRGTYWRKTAGSPAMII